jgi:uncharacterized linocin/CFP29 family protein
MYQRNADLQWTDEQWNRVCKVVADEAQRVRLATKFLPVYGPVDTKELAVPNFWLQPGAIPPPPGAQPVGVAVNRLTVESLPLKLLTTIAINVHVRTHEAADPELGAVISMFRRAANLIARTEDALMFNGQAAAAAVPPGAPAGGVVANVTGGSPQYGLLGRQQFGLPNFVAGWAAGGAGFPAAPGFPIARGGATVAAAPVAGQASTVVLQAGLAGGPLGQEIVQAVSKALGSLESCGYTGPFACVLGSTLFDAVHEPTAALILARDRILPFLEGGPLLRCTLIDPDQGLIVAYGSGQVEQVLASDICVKLLQVSEEPRYVFRICERVALRVRDWNAVVNIC